MARKLDVPADIESKDEDLTIGQPSQEKPKAKSLQSKGALDRHPVTATIPVKKRSALETQGAKIMLDEDINPDGVTVKLGTIASLFVEIVADICLDDEEGMKAINLIAESADPKRTIGMMAIQYKMNQKISGSAVNSKDFLRMKKELEKYDNNREIDKNEEFEKNKQETIHKLTKEKEDMII